MTEKVEAFILEVLKCAPVTIEPISQGRNSRVHRCVLKNEERVVVKEYFQSPVDKRNRFRAEIDAIRFMQKIGILNVPTIKKVDEFKRIVVLEEIVGDPIAKGDVTDFDIQQAVLFLQALHKSSSSNAASFLDRASESCFTTEELKENFHIRANRLENINDDYPTYSLMKEFLKNDLLPLVSSTLAEFEDIYGSDWSLLNEHKTLSPSDFGFHNALRCTDGLVVFLDFEYFGWDDPAKTICDFLLHESMSLCVEHKHTFIQKMLHTLTNEADFLDRLKISYRLFGLKWCFILLNEFVSSDRIRRSFAGVGDYNIPVELETQLDKSRKLWQRIYEREDESLFRQYYS